MNTALLNAPQIRQPERGYRFSSDSVALAEFAQAGPVETVLDLCSGCAVVPILMWLRTPFRYGLGIDLDSELTSLARSNLAQLGLESKIQIMQADIRLLKSHDIHNIPSGSSSALFDVVTANPPYWPAGHGRLNPNMQSAFARHEICLSLGELFDAARRFIRPGGRFYLSHLESRQGEILRKLKQREFVVRQTRRISGRTGRLLFEARFFSVAGAEQTPSESQSGKE